MDVVAMKHIASNFAKLDKFEGVDVRRRQKKMRFLLSSMTVVYVLTTLIPDYGDDATVDQLRKRAKMLNISKNYRIPWRPNIWLRMHQVRSSLFTKHKMNMDESIQVSCIIDKLPPSWKDFKHILKHLKEELTLVELGSHLRIEESFRAQDSDKPKGNIIVGPQLNIVNDNIGSAFMSTFKLNDSIIWFCYVSLLHTKDEALDKLKVFKTEVKLQQRSLIKRFRTDRGGECMDTLYFQSVGIIYEMTAPYTPKQNGIECIFVGYAEHSKAFRFYVIELNDSVSFHGFRFYVIEPNDSVAINSIIKSKDVIFDENRFSSVLRPSFRIPNRTEDIGGSVVPEEDLDLAYSQMYNGKSRHLGVRHSMIHELITNGVVSIEFARSQRNLVDHLTKGLARDLVLKSAEGMGLNGLEHMYLHIIPRMCLEPAENEDEVVNFLMVNFFEKVLSRSMNKEEPPILNSHLSLAQKAKLKWALEGDENSSFFHSTLKKKRRHLAIKGILKNGEWIKDPNLVKADFLDHFRTRFKLVSGISPLDADMFNPLSSSQRESLDQNITRGEIKRAVWDCGGDRAPSPDGFTFKFFKTFWDLIEGDVVRFMLDFFRTNSFPKGCNSSFIALIPNVHNAKLLKNLDGPLILNRILAWYQERNKKLMVFKVDFEKAFDSLCWDFLDLVMEKLGFGLKWHSWIQGCLRNARSSILVNGFPTAERRFGLIKGDCIGRDNMSISHLMYADDVIFFGDWSRHVILMNVISCMANVIGCGVAKFPLKYLGVPIGCNMNRCSNWSPIIKKFSSKLSIWKARLLSVGGHLTLIKPVLCNLPTYYMSIYSMPDAVCNKLESMRNKFFIGCDHDEKKMTWVKWKRCLASKSQGGLGIEFPYCESDFSYDWGKGYWGILRRNPRGGAEQSQFDAILSAIENVTLSDKSDSWQWLIYGCNGFSIALARSLVDSFFLDGDTIATRWNKFIPIKVNVFLWRLNLNKLPTRVNLDRKGIDIGSILCPTCQGDVETVNHTFFNCVLAKDLWTLMAKWWELDIPIFANIFEWYAWLDSLHFSSVTRMFIEGVGGILLWSIWSFCNQIQNVLLAG
ncbi:putative RNA-directed DNA polymerase, eukaryota, reverse transcriptase zinc-binding domain protein [Tanacetum coccineum]